MPKKTDIQWSDGESNPDLLNAIQEKGDTSGTRRSVYGDMTTGDVLELRHLENRRQSIANALAQTDVRETTSRGKLLIEVLRDELQRVTGRLAELRQAQAVSHG